MADKYKPSRPSARFSKVKAKHPQLNEIHTKYLEKDSKVRSQRYIKKTSAKSSSFRNMPTYPLVKYLATVFLVSGTVYAGPTAYGICQTGCAGIVTACYGAAGFTWGATIGATAPATVIACNLAFGKCQAACAAVLLAPTP